MCHRLVVRHFVIVHVTSQGLPREQPVNPNRSGIARSELDVLERVLLRSRPAPEQDRALLRIRKCVPTCMMSPSFVHHVRIRGK